ncbi:protein takeout-like isoform X2 [Haematobia irritans]|uniref:protein takeout-like isoform X2 n=1 Tax=Haematobia irritans TaxID=7368 RepID=UPI003F4F9B07
MSQIFKIYLTIATVASVLIQCYCGDLPSDIQKCRSGDDTCIRDAINQVHRKFPTGNPQFGLANLSSVSRKNVAMARPNPNSAIQLNFTFLEMTMRGLENIVVANVTGWTKDPRVIESYIFIPSMEISGPYETNGKVLLLSLDGKGEGVVTLTNVTSPFKMKVDVEKRSDGKRYCKVSKIKIRVQPSNYTSVPQEAIRMVFKLENLVKNSQELSNTLNDVLNENWRDFWNKLSDNINTVVSEIIADVFTGVFSEFSLDDFFVE